MIQKIKTKFQCFKGKGQNSNVLKEKVTIIMFGRIGPEF